MEYFTQFCLLHLLGLMNVCGRQSNIKRTKRTLHTLINKFAKFKVNFDKEIYSFNFSDEKLILCQQLTLIRTLRLIMSILTVRSVEYLLGVGTPFPTSKTHKKVEML
jgi:hypothetical protein